jgi:DNA-binding transcriptional LysR family regulator
MGIDLDLRRLRLFTEVVRQGGFTKASRTAFASQPTLSKAVKQLEDELGVHLFNRAGRRIELTPEGRLVYSRALALLSQSADLAAELEAMRGLQRGSFRLGFPRLGSTGLFASMYASFRRRFPGIEVSMSVHNRRTLEQQLRAGELDLAVMAHPVAGDLERQEYRTDRLVALVPGRSSSRTLSTPLAALAGKPLILSGDEETLDALVLDAYRKAKLVPEISAQSAQVDFIFELVAAGTGIAFLPRAVAEQRKHRSVRIVLVRDPVLEWRLAFAWRRGAHLSVAARAWLEHAANVADEPRR